MSKPFEQSGWSRRRFIATSAAAASSTLMPRALGAQTAPWSVRPPGNPPGVTFVVWQYGNIYAQISQQFEQDWSVKINQIIEPNVEPMVAKLTAMYAAGDAVDVSLSPIQYLSSFIEQGIAQPIDGLPGVDQYVKDFTPFTRATAQRNGKTWGLPYFSTVWVFIYNDEMLTKAGFKDKPFKSYPELLEQARKAKRDGVAKYPILWVAGAGFEQLPATWFSMTHNRGGAIFDKQLNPQLGPGSIARETLKWWQSTFKEELADPNSLNLRFIPAVKAFNAGQHVYLGTLHHYYLSLVNDQAQSPIAGKGRVLALPGDGKTIGYTMLYILCSATKNKEWAWKLQQYLGGRTKNGEYTQANRLATDAMLGSGYQSVMDSELLRKGWAKWGDVPTILNIWSKASNFADVVPTVYQPWYPRWNDAMNVELTSCLQGKTSADQACDNMVAAIAKAKKA
ncbi:MAG TPA: extracellular solute-binding protein [Methylomirabilota bacterium]|jgi:ABC-type glycerol-3-phosphate transport system substrate-binding protein|nr:extracellular solute-binding protein [Methylomirabilota bacterium]